MFGSQFMPCPECGASVPRTKRESHLCEQDRRLDYQMFQLRHEVGRFDAELADYLGSPRGRFELWYAMRQRQAEPGPHA